MNWLLFRRAFHFVFLIGITALAVLYWLKSHERKSAEQIPVVRAVPDFALTERSGKTVQLSDLRGKVWIADFVFTRCAGPCPLMTARMAKLQQSLKDATDVRLVSFSVDPDRDTPQVLTEYAKNFEADPSRWLFLTGNKAAVYELANKGFLISAVENIKQARPPDEGPILHSTKFVLVDRKANIRGYYDGIETNGFDRLLRDVRIILREKSL